MELTPELEEIFASRSEQLSRIELTYKNGGKVIGTIKKLRHSPLRLVIQKSVPEKGERPRHKVVFDHVTRLQVIFQDGTVKIFSQAE